MKLGKYMMLKLGNKMRYHKIKINLKKYINLNIIKLL